MLLLSFLVDVLMLGLLSCRLSLVVLCVLVPVLEVYVLVSNLWVEFLLTCLCVLIALCLWL